MEKVTVQELDQKLQSLRDLAVKKGEFEDELKNINKQIQRLEGQCLQWLTELDREDYESANGKIVVSEKITVRMPEDEAEKQKFWNYLKAEGIFDTFATVQSQSLNKLWRETREEAIAQGADPMLWNLPGLPAPVLDRFAKFKPPRR